MKPLKQFAERAERRAEPDGDVAAVAHDQIRAVVGDGAHAIDAPERRQRHIAMIHQLVNADGNRAERPHADQLGDLPVVGGVPFGREEVPDGHEISVLRLGRKIILPELEAHFRVKPRALDF